MRIIIDYVYRIFFPLQILVLRNSFLNVLNDLIEALFWAFISYTFYNSKDKISKKLISLRKNK